MSTKNCFSTQELRSWLDGASSLDGASRAAIELHVRECSDCQSILENACSLGEWRLSANSRLMQNRFLDEPECHEMVSRLREISPAHLRETAALRTTPFQNLSTSSLPPGQTFGHYQIVRELGRGGMSIVYEANDLTLRRRVAIKRLQARSVDDSNLRRFLREANAIAAIQHPNVVTIHEFKTESDSLTPYLIMEFVDGPSLLSRIQSGKPIPFRTAAYWIASIADALAAAHQCGIVHRDVKPSNILLATSKESLRASSDVPENSAMETEYRIPKLADFGLAQTEQLDAQLTQSGFLTGTPAYASPEQAAADRVSPASDIYSLGVTLFEALTGELPFRGTPHAVVRQILDSPFPNARSFNPLVPIDLETICLKACHHDPNSRYGSAPEFALDLRNWLDGRPIHARPSTASERCRSWIRRNRRVAFLLFAIFALMLTIAAGSIAATVAMANARNLIAKEAVNAKIAKELAEHASKSANAQSLIAKEQRELAFHALSSLVDEVQLKLANRVGTLQIRRELLLTALQGFERLSQEDEDDSILDHNRIAALIQLASIHSALGNRDEAKQVAEQAYAAAKLQFQQNAKDDSAITDLAETTALQADFSFAIDASDQTIPLYEQVLALLETAAKSSELSAKHRKIQFASALKLVNFETKAKRVSESIQKLETLLPNLEKAWNDYPTRVDLRRLRVNGIILLANAYSSIDLDKCRSCLEIAIELTNTLRKQDPDNYAVASDLTLLQARLARQEREAGQWDAAVERANAAVESVLQYAAMDRSNQTTQSQIGMIYDVQYEALLHASRLEEATVAAEHGYHAHAATLIASPSSLRFVLLTGESAAKVSDTYIRRRDYGQAVDWMKRCLEHYDQGRDLPEATPNAWGVYRKMMADHLASLQFAISNSNRIISSSSVEASLPDLASCAYISSLDGRFDDMERWIVTTVDMLNSQSVATDEPDQKHLAWKIMIKAFMVASLAYERESNQEASETYRDRARQMTLADWYPEADMKAWLRSEPDTQRLVFP